MTGCINHAFYHLCYDILTSWVLAGLEGTAPCRVGQFLEIIKDSPASEPCTCKTFDPDLICQIPPLWAFTLRATISLPNHPGPDTKKTRESPCAPEPMESFQLGQSWPVYPASPVSFPRNHNKGSCHSSPSVSWQTLVFPCACWCNPSSCDMWVSSQWQFLLICWPHHTWIIIKPVFKNRHL